MRLTVKIRALCPAGVAIVAVLAASEATARAGGRSASGQLIAGRGHGQYWGGGVHGAGVAHGGGRQASDLGGYWRRGLGHGGGYWGGYYGGGGVYYDDVGNYGEYSLDDPPTYGGVATIYAPNYYPASGYQAPASGYPSCAPAVSHGSDPHIIHLTGARRRGARKSCDCRAE